MSIHSKVNKVIVLSVALVLGFSGLSTTAHAAAKKATITCYKGTTAKKVTAVSPKCPTGYTTKKPVATPKASTPAASAGASTIAFSGSYKGTLSMMWSDSDVTVTSLSGTVNVTGKAVITGGTGKYVGASGKLTMTGSFAVKSTTAGSTEKDDFKVTLTGTIALKK